MKPETDNEDTEISHSETSPATKDTKESKEGKDLYCRMESLATERGCPRRAVVMEETHITRKHRPDLEGVEKKRPDLSLPTFQSSTAVSLWPSPTMRQKAR